MVQLSTQASEPSRQQWPLAIDGRMMGAGATGVTSYADALYRTLSARNLHPLVLDDGGPDARRSRLRKWLAAARPGVRPLSLSHDRLVSRDIFREAQVHFNLYGRLLQLASPGVPGLVHWTYPVPLHIRGWKNIYTVHDAIPLLRPDLTSISRRRHRKLLRQVMRDSDLIVTVSETARRDIAASTGHPIDRIANLSQVADVDSSSDASLPKGLEKEQYFLFAGGFEPRKNVDRLAAAHQRSGTTVPLVIVGSLSRRAVRMGTPICDASNVILLPPQPRASLLALIGGAKALLFPSLAEGFGLPIVEAMALGVPVLTSIGGATEETAGGAACLVDPLDVDAMAQAIARLDCDDSLRSRLRGAGLERASAFSAELYAERLRDLYVGVMNG